MKTFPIKLYEFKFLTTPQDAWDNLKENTKESYPLTSSKTDKKFIGFISVNHFKLISSVIGKGAFCTFEGKLDESKTRGTLRIEVYKAFKILLLICIALVIGGALFLLFTKGFTAFMKVFALLGLFVLIIRFLAFERLFKSVSENTINDLIEVMKLEMFDI